MATSRHRLAVWLRHLADLIDDEPVLARADGAPAHWLADVAARAPRPAANATRQRPWDAAVAMLRRAGTTGPQVAPASPGATSGAGRGVLPTARPAGAPSIAPLRSRHPDLRQTEPLRVAEPTAERVVAFRRDRVQVPPRISRARSTVAASPRVRPVAISTGPAPTPVGPSITPSAWASPTAMLATVTPAPDVAAARTAAASPPAIRSARQPASADLPHRHGPVVGDAVEGVPPASTSGCWPELPPRRAPMATGDEREHRLRLRHEQGGEAWSGSSS